MNLKELLFGFKKLDFNYWFFVFVILMFGGGTKIFSNFDPRFQPFSFCMLLFFLLGIIVKSRNQVDYSILLLLLSFLFPWFIYHYYVDTSFQYGLYSIFFLQFLLGFFASFHYKGKLLVYFEKIVVTFAVLSLPFWIMECFFGKVWLAQFAPFDNPFDNGSSFIVYTTLERLDTSSRETFYYGLARNTGFTWEAGRFATALVLAMSSHIVTHNGIKWKSWRFHVLLIALATTLSTTGYACFIVLIGLHYLFTTKIHFGYRIFAILILCFFVSYIMGLSFMRNKIEYNINKTNWMTNNVTMYNEMSKKQDKIWCVDRTEGLFLDWLNLQYKPLLGTGLAHNDTYLYKFISKDLTTSNGLLRPLSQLGLIIGIPFFVMLMYGIRRLSSHFNYSGINIIFIITIVIQYSYNFMFTSLFIALMCCSFAKKQKHIVIH